MKTRELKQELDKLDHLALFSSLLGLSEPLKPGKTVKSPIRIGDDHPSFNVYRGKNNQVYFKDFAFESGSVYDLTMLIHRCSFGDAVRILGDISGIVEMGATVPREFIKVPELVKSILPAKPTYAWFSHKAYPLDQEDLAPAIQYWFDLGLTMDELEDRRIFWAESFKMWKDDEDDKCMQLNDYPNDPLFVMQIGGHLKAYRPLHRLKPRYIGNTTKDDIFGIERVHYEPGQITLITAGQKDATVAEKHLRADELHVRTIAFNAEGTIPDETTMWKLFNASDRMAVCYDADETGIRFSTKMVERFPFVQRVPFETLYTDVKDISDAYLKYKELDNLRRFLQAQ